MNVRSFSQVSYYDYATQVTAQIATEIERNTKEYLLGVEEEEYKKFLIDKYSLEPLTVDSNNCSMGHPTISKEWFEDHFRERYQKDVYTFTLKYPYTGSSDVFKIRPSTYTMTSTDLFVDQSTVSFSFKVFKQDPQEFERAKNEHYSKAFTNVSNANQAVTHINNEIRNFVNNHFRSTKEKYQKENNFFEAINLKVNNNSVFTAPTVKKKIIPQPVVSKSKEFSSEPAMAKEIYEDILNVIYNSGKNMETKPSLYQNKDEEGLRDQFLYVLESRYDGTTATGETFNRSGKADILLKYAKDSTNIFVAECKLWHGASEFQSGISQLFDRYLTWRDSKAALLLFVQNKDFSNVLQTIKNEAKKHPYFLKENGTKGVSSFSYIFRLPQDPNKEVYFEIMAFHYDK